MFGLNSGRSKQAILSSWQDPCLPRVEAEHVHCIPKHFFYCIILSGVGTLPCDSFLVSTCLCMSLFHDAAAT